MAEQNDSGHYAIAGFLYQLIGSGVEALKIYEPLGNQGPACECLVLERFGQDAAALPVNDGDRKPMLIQFKYSCRHENIEPAEIRAILERFLESVHADRWEIEQLEFKLVTNRPCSATARSWFDAKTKLPAELEKLIRKSSKSRLSNVGKLAAILQRLKLDEQDHDDFQAAITAAAAEFGILKNEITDRIRKLVGLFVQKGSNTHDRIVRRSEIHDALTGFESPYRLRDEESVQVRLNEVTQFQRDETGGKATIRRPISNDIGKAILEHPVTIVVGDGGSGKSIAASDAVMAALRNRNSPPGFGLVVPALRATPEFVMDAVARWRNRSHHEDGQAFTKSIDRLERAFIDYPLLVVCIDAIDEKEGRARLPSNVQSFIRELVNDAFKSHKERGVPRISVVLTCRRNDKLMSISRGSGISDEPFEIRVTDFDDSEMEILASGLADDVRNRILSHLPLRLVQVKRVGPRSIGPESPDFLQAIRHPVMWGIFRSMDEMTQRLCLDSNAGVDQLAAAYLNWFLFKTEIRICGVRPRECETALAAVAREFEANPAKIGDRQENWIEPCMSSTGCSELTAGQLLEEATTAGILIDVEQDNHKWRWKHLWFCQYLARRGMGCE